jgi:hypothetical protein
LFCVPVTQVLPEQQPVGQLSGPHACGWQRPLWQTRPGWFAQFWHASPPAPHALFWLPIAQTLPTQHPAHGVGLLQSVPATHAPPEQTWFAPHARHAWPFAPQACAVVETTHWLPAQQPGHVAGLHGRLWHVRAFGWPSPTQVCPPAHARQASPWRPHAVESAPVRQRPLASQQPPQFVALQTGVPAQRPPPPAWPAHVWPAAHVPHDAPPAPHAAAAEPGRHVSLTQQPGQFADVQLVDVHVRLERSHPRPFALQSVHSPPERPHATASPPERHRRTPPSLEQQPGQVAGPHAGSSRPHTPRSVQSAKPVATQSEQRPPPAPHARTSEPTRQVPVASQQPPGHVDGPQTPGAPPSESDSGSRLERPQP